ncbi:MAG: amidase [Synechococcales cyanobacterium C42_A2020_086]|jgi:amidase|nr:amidase [Synechococcales cyanobacterium C42_A2020_086]
MGSVDLVFASALEQARLIRSKALSPLELVQLYLDRIQALDARLGSFFLVMGEQALEDAKAKTEHLMQTTEPLPPFFGVPTAIKDLTTVSNVPCSYGVKILRNRIATEDAGVVMRLRQAGFVLLGKTATSELGSTPYTEPPGFPPTRNPWHLDYTPGGSSGGSAAAVAAGLCSVAQGSDGGGSIRGPAACCGIVGIKPARGRVSFAPTGDRLSGLATEGPLARTVADAAALLDVMAGPIVGDPYWLPNPDPSFLEMTQQPVAPQRIAFTTAFPPIGFADPTCEAAVLETVRRLEELGHSVESIDLDFTDLVEPLVTVWQAGVDVGIPGIFLSKFNRWLLRRSRSRSGGDYLMAVARMQIAARRLVATLQPFDVLVAPVFLHPTIRVGEWARLRPAKILNKIMQWVAPCPPFNATGQPAISIPADFDANGLPVGIQLVGRPADEATIIALAAQLEAANPWSQRRPPLATE